MITRFFAEKVESMADGITKVTNPADPERCQGIAASGQCMNRIVPGTQYCPVHGGVRQQVVQERRTIYEINSARMRARLQSKTSGPDVLTLHDEVGVLRILLEDHLNTIQDGDIHDMIAKSGPISDLVAKIERAVVSCSKLELTRGQTLGRKQLAQFASSIAAAAAEQIGDPVRIKAFMDKVIVIMESLTDEEDAD